MFSGFFCIENLHKLQKMDLEGEISLVTNFTLGATAQATLVYIKFEIFIMVQ